MRQQTLLSLKSLFQQSISSCPENPLLSLHWTHLAAASPHQDGEHPEAQPRAPAGSQCSLRDWKDPGRVGAACEQQADPVAVTFAWKERAFQGIWLVTPLASPCGDLPQCNALRFVQPYKISILTMSPSACSQPRVCLDGYRHTGTARLLSRNMCFLRQTTVIGNG